VAPRLKTSTLQFKMSSLRLDRPSDELAKAFTKLESARDLARLLDVKYSTMVFHTYRLDRYQVFTVSKKSGGVRRICAPVTALKLIQQKLNQVLQAVYEPRASTHGFVINRNIVSNARRHRNKRWVLNVDIENFFPSITSKRVYGLFRALPYRRNADVAAMLTRICCNDGELPQGAPTSPVISNMICSRLDSQLQRLAQQHRCTYTRYADDITFSTSHALFPQELAWLRPYPAQPEAKIGPGLEAVIKANGFAVNHLKVRLRRYDRRQEVTGLTVNSFPNVTKRFRSQLRAMLHAWEKWGYDAAEAHFRDRYDQKHRNPSCDPPSFRRVVKGKLDFLGMVRERSSKVYRSFLDRFHIAELVSGSPTTDAVVKGLLRSYSTALRDPANEFIHLYEIRDALAHRFGSAAKARSALGLKRRGWDRLGKLANDLPIKQGRHRGQSSGSLRDATETELQEARSIARNMIRQFLAYLNP